MAVTGYANSTYRWRTGFVNENQLTSTYNLTSFTRFDDMKGTKWFNPEDDNPFPEGAVVEGTLGGDFSAGGLAAVDWKLAGLTPQMVNFVLNDASLFNGAMSMDSTISTWNTRDNRWEFVWVKTARRGLISEVGEFGYNRGLRALTISHLVLQDAP